MGRKIILKESELISLIEKVVKEQSRLSEDKNWIQKANKESEKDGTEGAFGNWCRSKGYKNGCSEACIEEGRKRGGVWQERADYAHTLCGF